MQESATESAASEAPADPASVQPVSLSELAAHTSAYARAWGGLFLSEAALAKRNLIRILLVALVVPAIALSILLCVDALIAGLLEIWLHTWIGAIALTLLCNMIGLAGLFFLLRSWWRTLSLPRTRAALTRLMEAL
jgi:hypothetical protein